MSRNTKLNVVFTSEDVRRLQERAAAAFNTDTVVIDDNVTARIMRILNEEPDVIAAAGVSGMAARDGVLVNRPGLYISDGYSGKLSGHIEDGARFADGTVATEEMFLEPMIGISGYAGVNYTCLFRALCGVGICSKCFSLTTPYYNSIKAWTRNDVIMSSVKLTAGDVVLDPDKIPYVRFSSHGDLLNGLHAYNFLTIAASNPDVNFALWTKNADYMRAGMELFGAPRPNNLTLIYSALRMDVTPSAAALKALKAAGFDALFSVYNRLSTQTKAVSGGAWHCMCGNGSCRHRCQFCYNPAARAARGFADPSRAVLIAEILDGGRHRE